MACCTIIWSASSWVVAISCLCMAAPQLISMGHFSWPVLKSLWRSLHMISNYFFSFRAIVKVTFWDDKSDVRLSWNTLQCSTILEVLVEDFVLKSYLCERLNILSLTFSFWIWYLHHHCCDSQECIQYLMNCLFADKRPSCQVGMAKFKWWHHQKVQIIKIDHSV